MIAARCTVNPKPTLSSSLLLLVLLATFSFSCQGLSTSKFSYHATCTSSCYHRRQSNKSKLFATSSSSDGLKNPSSPTPPSPPNLNPTIVTKTEQIDLSSGINAQIMYCKPLDDKTPLSSLAMVFSSKPKPPLVFIHGSFHASWCWAEHFLPYFAALGYPSYALSLRGTGGTFAGEGVKTVKIMDHVSDIESFLEYVNNRTKKEEGGRRRGGQEAPVLLGHSFGGLAIMKLLEKNLSMDYTDSYRYDKNNNDNNDNNDHDDIKGKSLIPDFLSARNGWTNNRKSYESKDTSTEIQNHTDSVSTPQVKLSGVCLMCSVPPSGNGKMTLRFLKRSLRDSWKITAGLALKKCITDEELCRDLFFGGNAIVDESDGHQKIVEDWGVSDDDLRRYQEYFERDTVATISLRDLAKRLPSIMTDKSGKALFKNYLPPSLVIGASDDFIVDSIGVMETAKYFDVEPVKVDSPHDVMLGRKWANTATSIAKWLESIMP